MFNLKIWLRQPWSVSLIVFAFLFMSMEHLSQAEQLTVVIETDGTNFRVISQKNEQQNPPAMYRQIFADGFYLIEAQDAQGVTVTKQSLSDPTVVNYDYIKDPQSIQFQGNTGVALAGGVVKLKLAQLVVRLPVNNPIKKLQIYRQKLKNNSQGFQASVITVNSGQIQSTTLPENFELELKATLEINQNLTTGGG